MEPSISSERQTVVGRVLHAMIEHPFRVIGVLAVVSVVLTVAGISLAPDDEASFSPGGEAFDTGELVEREFRPSTTELQFIVEDEDGDALDLATLREWNQNSNALRSDGDLSDELSTYFDDDLGIAVSGTYSLADAVDEELRAAGVSDGLESASADDVKVALSNVLAADRPTVVLRDLLSVNGEVIESTVAGSVIDLWTAPAFVASVRVDHSAFPIDLEDQTDPTTRTDAEQDEIDAERDLDIEEWARDAQDVLRGDEANFQAWGLAIDRELTSDESFQATIPFLLGAITLIVLLVGVFLRSYWAAALAGVGLGATLLWARMISNIAGFEESIILDVIVPIATISFGVDFMIHAVGRCREELAGGKQHRSAYAIGIAAVGGALVLALSTSAIAFGSNATSGIEGVIQFGFGAAISLGSAFVMLGVLAPMFLLRIEEALAGAPEASGSPFSRIGSGFRILIAAVIAGVMVIAIIGVPFIGLVAVILYSALVIAVPLWWTGRSAARHQASGAAPAVANTAGQSMASAGTAIAAVVRLRYLALVVIAGVTAIAVVGASNVGTKTEPSDFFPSNSDFVTSIDKILEHTTSLAAGDVLIYIEGRDLADPRTLSAAAEVVGTVGAEGGDLFSQNPDGSFAAPDSALDVARAAVAVDYAGDAISAETGAAITDDDGDGFPDSAEQVEAVFSYASQNGIPAGETVFVYTADEVATLLARPDGETWATTLSFPMQGFGDSSRVQRAEDIVAEGETDLLAAVGAEGLNIETSISGEALTEQLALDAITDSMVISVPLAMILCVIVAGFVMRSPRLALASIIPIGLVIAWLLGFMYAFDFDINIVTATIAAISVGVGIDYSIHYTMRFREEWRRTGDRLEGIRLAAEGTGTALVLSGGTSIIGFLLLALAPMPIFAAYGLLTAVMIALSLLASLTVLPSLLYILAPSEKTVGKPVASSGESSAS
ncbi:MAG TPA: MMPL family transporter [Dehalococcoidia bacterium]